MSFLFVNFSVMKRFLRYLLLFLSLIILFFVYTFYSTGFFREVTPFQGQAHQSFSILGTEDLTIAPNGQFAIISSFGSRGLGGDEPGGLYYYDLQSENARPQLLNHNKPGEFYPHGISLYQLDSNRYHLLVINHVEEEINGEKERVHSIEVFHLKSDTLLYQRTIKDKALISPNDIVAIDENRYCFTNDHGTNSKLGRFTEDYLGFAKANAVFFNGTTFQVVAEGLSYANGINYDAKRQLLYIANTRGFDVDVYSFDGLSTIDFIQSIDCGTGVDNIELDADGKLWIGCHPSLMHFAQYASGSKEKSPSEIITIDYQDKDTYTVESIFVDDGSLVSGTSVASPFQDKILVGNVMDDQLIILNR